MHIVLGLLGAIVTILILLHRLADAGISLGGLNPFLPKRSRAWRQKFEANPIFSLDDPRELAAVLIVGVAKIDGDMSVEEKRTVLAELESAFGVGPNQTADLVASSVHLLGDGQVLVTQLEPILANCRELLSAEQIESMLQIMVRVASVDDPPTVRQQQLIEDIRNGLVAQPGSAGTWG